QYAGSTNYSPGMPYVSLDALRMEFPQITIGALRVNKGSQITVLEGNTADPNQLKKFIEPKGLFFGDADFFKVIHYKWLMGNPSSLNTVNNVVLSKSTAQKYFGDWQSAVGKLLKLDNHALLTVSGIIDDPEENTDLPLSVVVSLETLKA